jgi:hypothetical protein
MVTPTRGQIEQVLMNLVVKRSRRDAQVAAI